LRLTWARPYIVRHGGDEEQQDARAFQRGAAIEAFIARWQGRAGRQERANYAMFLAELCAALDLSPPDPASATTEENDPAASP